MTLALVQATSFCNIDCSYCYVAGRADRTRISIPLVKRIVEQLLAAPDLDPDIFLQWHIGEPLTAGLSFYEEVFDFVANLDKGSRHIHHSMQTNAILIDERWCDLFGKHHVSVGVSLDGPEHLHDNRRITRAGAGTHKSTLSGLQKLRAANITHGVLAVITEDTINCDPKEFLDFFVENGIRWLGFNTEQVEGENTSTSFEENYTNRYRQFVGGLFEAWLDCRDKIEIREFVNIAQIMALLHRGDDVRTPNEAAPWRILTFDRKGRVFTYNPELAGYEKNLVGPLDVGNVGSSSLQEIMESSKAKDLICRFTESSELCREQCEYFAFCGSAYFSNKIAENKSLNSTETQVCRLHVKTMVSEILSRMQTEKFAETLSTPPGDNYSTAKVATRTLRHLHPLASHQNK